MLDDPFTMRTAILDDQTILYINDAIGMLGHFALVSDEDN